MSKGGSSHRLADRLVALLREWDDDGTGTSSRRDVQMALQALGLYANAASVDGLFEEATLVLDGRLKYDALGRTLRRRPFRPASPTRRKEEAVGGRYWGCVACAQ